jgi:hypothetical protein
MDAIVQQPPSSPKPHQTTRRILHLTLHLLQHFTINEHEVLHLLRDEAGTPPTLATLRKYMRTLRCAGFAVQRHVVQGQVSYRLTASPFVGNTLPRQHSQAIEELLVYLPNTSTLHQKLSQLLPSNTFDFMPYSSPLDARFLHSIQHLPQVDVFQQLAEAIEHELLCGLVLYQSTTLSERNTELWGTPYLCTPVGLRDALISFLHRDEKYLFHVKLSHIHYLTIGDETQVFQTKWFTPLVKAIVKLHPPLSQKYQLKPSETMEDATETLHITNELPFNLLRRLLKYDKLCTVVSPTSLCDTHQTFTALQQRIMQHQRHSGTCL